MTADTELLYVHSLSQLREENKRLREQCRALWKLFARGQAMKTKVCGVTEK